MDAETTTGQSGAGITDISTVTNGFASNTIQASAGCVIIDYLQTQPPFAPIGTFEITIDMTTSLTTSSNHNGFVYNSGSASVDGTVNYVLADHDGIPAAGVFLQESYTFTAAGAMHGAITGTFGGVQTPGMNVGFGTGVDANGLLYVNSFGVNGQNFNNGPVFSGSSGTFMDQDGAMVTYSYGPLGGGVTVITNLGNVPGVTRGSDGTIAGTPWNVQYYAGTHATWGGDATAGMVLSASSYNAKFLG